MGYIKDLEKLTEQEWKIECVSRHWVRKIMRKHPKWYITFNYTKGRLHKKFSIMAEHHYINVQNYYNFEIDMRTPWKRQIKEGFKYIEEYVERANR